MLKFIAARFSLAIVALGAVVMTLLFISVEVNANRIGGYGVAFRGNTDVVDVSTPQGDLRTGDRIDLARLTAAQRFSFLAAPSGATMTVRAIRDGRSFDVTLSSVAPDYSRRTELARDIGIPLCFFLSLGLASALLLLRPRTVTLAFYGYVVLMLLKVYQNPLQLAAWPMNFTIDLLQQVIYPLAQLAILGFAQHLYGTRDRLSARIFGLACAVSVVVFFVWLDPILWLTTQRFGVPGPGSRLLMPLADMLLLAIVLCGLAYVASGAQALDRRRGMWILGGIALAPIVDLAWAVAETSNVIVGGTSETLLAVEVWTDALLPWVSLLGVIAVLYGFLSSRVVDVRVAIGRAAVYGAMTALLVLTFGAVEWFAEQIFESTRPAMYASLIAALAIGFAMRAVHGRFEAFVDSVLFGAQHRAQAALRRAARSLSNTTSERTLVEFLIDEPFALLALSSAALFLSTETSEVFELAHARGWGKDDPSHVAPDEPIVVVLRSELAPITLEPRLRDALRLPGGARLDAYVVPLVMRGKLFGFAFYGERSDAAAFSADERELLATIGANAAAAYDHIDATRCRERVEALEAALQKAGLPLP